MATKATIYKALLNIANMDSQYIVDGELTLIDEEHSVVVREKRWKVNVKYGKSDYLRVWLGREGTCKEY